ncbi:porin family protein [Lysobacter terrae]
MKKTLILSCALALASLSANALAAEGAHGFVRAEVGNSNIEIDNTDGDDTAYAVRGGYFFNANVGVEGFYSNFGEDEDEGVSGKITGYGVGVVAKKNFGPDNTGVYIDGRAGVVRAKTEVSVTGLGSADDTSTKPYFGVGVGYDFSDAFGLSLNYGYVSADAFGEDVNVQTLTVGGEFRF